jgi:hypothetical protein
MSGSILRTIIGARPKRSPIKVIRPKSANSIREASALIDKILQKNSGVMKELAQR